jgi:hypothetical protein
LWRGHKYPAWDFIYGCLWKANEDVWERQFFGWLKYVDQYLEGGSLDASVMFKNQNVWEVGNLVKSYCYWLSHELEVRGEVLPEDVYGVIDELLEKFPFDGSGGSLG